ncbi:hypothetical protein ACFQX7_36820 [Luedemannella flava]
MNWSRLAKIMTESGEHIEVTYAPANCVPGSSMPDKSALQNNTLRCYPSGGRRPGSSTRSSTSSTSTSWLRFTRSTRPRRRSPRS